MARYIDIEPIEMAAKDGGFCAVSLPLINEQPTADVVEVVRCKDCKWWRDTDHTCREWGGASPRLANAFCSNGERRENG